MKVVKVIAVMALALVVAGLVLGTGCGSQGPVGATGATGATGPQGPAGFGWGTPTNYGPYVPEHWHWYWLLVDTLSEARV